MNADPLAQEDFLPDPLELDPAAGNLPAAHVTAVGVWRRLQLAEPVRLYLYPVAVAVLGLLVALGIVSDELAPAYEALLAAVLAVGGPVVVERVRGAVWSPRSAGRAASDGYRAGAADERAHALSLTTRAVAASRKPAPWLGPELAEDDEQLHPLARDYRPHA